MIEAFEKIKKVTQVKPNSVAVSSFFVAKSDEIYNVFEKADLAVRTKAANILLTLDPANSAKYEKLLKN
jgi:hypothetical protein